MKEVIEAIKEYIEFAKREHEADLRERDSARPDVMSYHNGIVNAGQFNIEHETFQALEAIIAEDKPCSLCYEREFDFEGMICPKCAQKKECEGCAAIIKEIEHGRMISGYCWICFKQHHKPEEYKPTYAEYVSEVYDWEQTINIEALSNYIEKYLK